MLSESKCCPGSSHIDECACLAPLSRTDYTVVPVRNRNRTRLFDMVIHRSDHDAVSRSIRTIGFWDLAHPRELAELAGSRLPDTSHSGDGPPVFLDIGANLGFYSLLFASIGFSVFAIDPMNHNRRALNASLCLNPPLAQRVTLINAALGAPSDAGRACTVESIRLRNGGIGNGVLHCEHERVRNSSTAIAAATADRTRSSDDVDLTTLDTLLLRSPYRPRQIDVVKIDIEGSECRMLEGAGGVLDHFRPKLIQWEGKLSASDACLRRAVSSRGYRIGPRNGRDANTVAVSAAWDRHVEAHRAVGARAKGHEHATAA